MQRTELLNWALLRDLILGFTSDLPPLSIAEVGLCLQASSQDARSIRQWGTSPVRNCDAYDARL